MKRIGDLLLTVSFCLALNPVWGEGVVRGQPPASGLSSVEASAAETAPKESDPSKPGDAVPSTKDAATSPAAESTVVAAPVVPHQRLKVSDNGRYLTDVSGKPFFYLADTAWELFHRLNREEAALYLDDRASKGFTVIQAVALAELDGLNTPNAYGHRPLIENDPTRPDVRPGRADDYWDFVDDVIKMAEERGLFIALLPTWGDKWAKKHGIGPEIFNPVNAEAYGEWLGRRYREAPVIWVLGGDRDPENEVQVEIIRAMARGLEKGDGGAHLKTYHPQGTSNSAQIFHADEWLDFNMIQSGHVRPVRPNSIDAQKNLNRTPTKPTLDGEPCYEDHPIKGEDWNKRDESGSDVKWFDEADVRRCAYESMIAGACGHTYGNHNIWQFWQPDRKPISLARTPWQKALHHPGATQMKYLKGLLTARPFWELRYDPSLIVKDEAAEENGAHAALAQDGAFALVYLPTGSPCTIRLDKISGTNVDAYWFNPRQNTAQKFGTFPKSAELPVIPPHSGRNNDWVLILEDSSRTFDRVGDSY